MISHPDRTVTDRYAVENDVEWIATFDVNLGELMPKHEVMIRGIEHGRRTTPYPDKSIIIDELDSLHFEHVPGLDSSSVTPDWSMTISDDVGTEYLDDDSGSYDGRSGGAATHGKRDIGRIPADASRITLYFQPARGWQTPVPWVDAVVLERREGVWRVERPEMDNRADSSTGRGA